MNKIPVYRRAQFFGWSLVDPDDFDDILRFLWYAKESGHVYRNLSGGGVAFMHRQIMGLDGPAEIEVDHFNGDPLDNRRANLRLATRNENAQNLTAHRGATSQHRGVHWNTRLRKWTAQVRLNGHTKHLGTFENELQAAAAAAAWRAEHMPFANSARDRRSRVIESSERTST